MPRILRKVEKHSEYFLGFLVTLIISSSLLQFLMSPSGFNQGDSWAYNFGSSPNRSNISFTGHSLRKWPIVLINLILQKEPFQILAQTLFSIVAWIFLIITLGRVINLNKFSLILITCISISPQVLSWNSIQLSESYSISSGVFLLSSLLRYQKNRSFLMFVFVCSSLFFFLNTKPSNFITFIFLFPFLMMVKVSRNTLMNLAVNIKRTSIVGLILLYSGLLTLNQSMSDLQSDGFGQSYSAAQSVAVISNVNPFSSKVEQELLKTETLKCLMNFSQSSPVEITNSLKHECHMDEKWLSNGFQKWYLKFLLSHPDYVFGIIGTGFLAGNSPFSLYGASVSILPKTVTALFFGERNYANRLNGDSASDIPLDKLEVTSPIIFWLIVFLISPLIRLFCRMAGHKHISTIEGRASLPGIVGIYGITLMIISSISIPNEWFRQSIVGQLALLVAGVFYLQRLISEFSKG